MHLQLAVSNRCGAGSLCFNNNLFFPLTDFLIQAARLSWEGCGNHPWASSWLWFPKTWGPSQEVVGENCYEMNVRVPLQNPCIETLPPNVIHLEARPLEDKQDSMRLWGWKPHDEISVLIRAKWAHVSSLCSSTWGHKESAGCDPEDDPHQNLATLAPSLRQTSILQNSEK